MKESKWVLARVRVRGVGRDGPRLMGRLGRAWGVGDRVRGKEGLGVGRESGGAGGGSAVQLPELIRLVGFIVSKSHPGKLTRPALEAGDFRLDVTRGAARVAGGNKSRLALEEEPAGLGGRWGEDQDSQGESMQVCPRAASGLREPLPTPANKRGRCLGRAHALPRCIARDNSSPE